MNTKLVRRTKDRKLNFKPQKEKPQKIFKNLRKNLKIIGDK